MAQLAVIALAATAPISAPFAVALAVAGTYLLGKAAPMIAGARIEGLEAADGLIDAPADSPRADE